MVKSINSGGFDVVGHFEMKLPDPSRKTWDGSASTKPARIDKGCLRRGRPLRGRASVLPIKTKLTHYRIRNREESLALFY